MTGNCLTPGIVKRGVRPPWCNKKVWESAVMEELNDHLIRSSEDDTSRMVRNMSKKNNPLEQYSTKKLKKELKRRKKMNCL